MTEQRFRATRGPNVQMKPDDGLPDWGVYDSHLARVRSDKLIFTKRFAEILAASMNYAYELGRRER